MLAARIVQHPQAWPDMAQRILESGEIETLAERSIPRIRLPDRALIFARRATRLRKLAADADYSLALKDVKEIFVLPQDQNQNQVDNRNGHPDWNSRISPPLFVLIAKRPRGLVNVFLFSDEEMANRVAKAITHAVELCGGGKDAF